MGGWLQYALMLQHNLYNPKSINGDSLRHTGGVLDNNNKNNKHYAVDFEFCIGVATL